MTFVNILKAALEILSVCLFVFAQNILNKKYVQALRMLMELPAVMITTTKMLLPLLPMVLPLTMLMVPPLTMLMVPLLVMITTMMMLLPLPSMELLLMMAMAPPQVIVRYIKASIEFKMSVHLSVQ